jgi:protein PhnA
MAKGRDRHHARAADAAALGRQLSRRAKNCCEICEQSTSLKVIEVEPILEEPDLDRAIMVCANCEAAISGKGGPHNQMRCLESVAWSDITPVQLTALRLLRQLSERDVVWARDTIDSLFISPEVEALL